MLGVLAPLAACSRAPSERALRDAIDAMVDAVEARDPAALFAHVADDFTRDDGALDRRQMRTLLMGLFLRHRQIHVVTTIRELRIDGRRATVRLAVFATGGQGLLPEAGRTWDLTTAWRYDGKWMMYNAHWSD